MGCLNYNDGKVFEHRFANIHFSGLCNRKCYFCIGQHMPALDTFDNLNMWPLPGLEEFIVECKRGGITEVNLTGTDTDPFLYKHLPELIAHLRNAIPGVKVGVRTNGALAASQPALVDLFDKGSLSITSFDSDLYVATMGQGTPPDVRAFITRHPGFDLKVNIVLCPETLVNGDILKTLGHLADLGVKRVNLREPYGQPHVGDPFEGRLPVHETTFGMPTYLLAGTLVTYWDVHYVEVDSVNLYANGTVSTDYPVTLGYHKTGEVRGQENFQKPGRVREQWTNKPKVTKLP